MDLSGGTTFKDYVGSGTTGIIGVINTVIVPVIFTLALLVFVWGIVKYFIIDAGQDEARAKGKEFALWGIIGMVVLFGIWGFVNLMLSTLGIAPPQ